MIENVLGFLQNAKEATLVKRYQHLSWNTSIAPLNSKQLHSISQCTCRSFWRQQWRQQVEILYCVLLLEIWYSYKYVSIFVILFCICSMCMFMLRFIVILWKYILLLKINNFISIRKCLTYFPCWFFFICSYLYLWQVW